MVLRVGVLCAGLVGLGALAAGAAVAEELNPEQARAFVVGKLFSYTCFEGTVGNGRIFPDGSVVGTIRIRGQGQPRFAALPAGTVRVDNSSMCAHLSGMPITPCFRVQKIDAHSFRGSLSGLGFAYCDFYQRNPRTQLTSNGMEEPEETSVVASTRRIETPTPIPVPVRPVERAALAPLPVAHSAETPAATPVSNTLPLLRPSLAE
ncbi:MAG TPA: hypothetical protein VH206_03150 [Xanthobacteraceae bacterium]|jgi:hypothetical protein|nr:hypothetical protein [Xanthobacteraceae bacterium]